MAEKNYNIFARGLLGLISVTYILLGLDGYLEVQFGETGWVAGQVLRVVLSFAFSAIYSYIAFLPSDFSKKLKLGLKEGNRFIFLTFWLSIIFVVFLIIMPSS